MSKLETLTRLLNNYIKNLDDALKDDRKFAICILVFMCLVLTVALLLFTMAIQTNNSQATQVTTFCCALIALSGAIFSYGFMVFGKSYYQSKRKYKVAENLKTECENPETKLCDDIADDLYTKLKDTLQTGV